LKKIGLLLILLALGILSGFYLGESTGSIDLAKHNYPQQVLTEEQKILKQKMETRINNGWSDIKKCFNINEKGYFQLDISQKQAFKQGASPIKDKEMIESILTGAVNPGTSGFSAGSLFPLILIKNDGSEVLIGIKEADGNNILKKCVLKDDSWVTETSEKMGKPLM
jgi:hypothetical protein